MNLIGIDPGTHTGMAFFKAGKLVELAQLDLFAEVTP